MVLIHMASVWVPFTSESKEAIADYDEIRKEMTLALRECGRKLGTYLRRRKRMARETERRSVFERYIGEIATNCEAITGADAKAVYEALMAQARRKTEEADHELDEDGKIVDDGGRLARDETVVIIEERQASLDDEDDTAAEGLFEDGQATKNAPKRKTKRKTTRKKKTRK